MLSVGYSTGLSLCSPIIPTSREIMPTLPRNMADERSSFDPVDKSGVIPKDDPTVNSAEHDSKSRLLAGNSGSKAKRTME